MAQSRKWLAAGLAVAVVMAVATWNWAAAPQGGAVAPAGGTKVAVVDLVRVFNEFDQTKVLNQKMSALEDQLRNEDQLKNQEIETQKSSMRAYAPDDQKYKDENKKLRQSMVDYQVWKMTKQDEVGAAHLRWVNKTYKKVEDEIAAVAKAKGFQLVVTHEDLDTSITDSKVMLKQIISRKVIYSDPGIDLTDEVLDRLNAAFLKDGGAKSIDFNS